MQSVLELFHKTKLIFFHPGLQGHGIAESNTNHVVFQLDSIDFLPFSRALSVNTGDFLAMVILSGVHRNGIRHLEPHRHFVQSWTREERFVPF